MKSKELKSDKYFWLADKVTTDAQRKQTLRQGLLKALKEHNKQTSLSSTPCLKFANANNPCLNPNDETE